MENQELKKRRKNPEKKSEWVDHIVPEDNDDVLAERSTLVAGPKNFIRIKVVRERNRLTYRMSCNLMRDPVDEIMFHTLSAGNMKNAKEESIDMVRILLHNALSDL